MKFLKNHFIVLVSCLFIIALIQPAHAKAFKEQEQLSQKIMDIYNYKGGEDVLYANKILGVNLKRELKANSHIYVDRYIYIGKLFFLKMAEVSIAIARETNSYKVSFDLNITSQQCWDYRSFFKFMTLPPTEQNSVMSDPTYAIYERDVPQEHLTWVSEDGSKKLSINYVGNASKYGDLNCISEITISRER